MCNIVGKVGVTPRMFDIKSQYNDYMYEALWIGVEEVSNRGKDKLTSAAMRELITGDTVNINVKGSKQHMGYPVYARLFFMTNELDALPIDESDRRFWVVGFNDISHKPRSVEYYTNLANTFEDKSFQQAVMYDLLNRDISKFTPGKIPFHTNLKETMIYESRSAAEKALAFFIRNKNFPPIVTLKELKQWIYMYCETNGIGVVHERDIASTMQKYPWFMKDNKVRHVRVDSERLRFKILRDTEDWQQSQPVRTAKVWEQYQTKKDKISFADDE